MLSLHGPVDKHERARAMADAFILNSEVAPPLLPTTAKAAPPPPPPPPPPMQPMFIVHPAAMMQHMQHMQFMQQMQMPMAVPIPEVVGAKRMPPSGQHQPEPCRAKIEEVPVKVEGGIDPRLERKSLSPVAVKMKKEKLEKEESVIDVDNQKKKVVSEITISDDEDTEEIPEHVTLVPRELGRGNVRIGRKPPKTIGVDIVLRSVGWRELGSPYHYDFDDMLDGNKGVVERMEKIHGVDVQDLYVDCRPLKSNGVKHLLGHTGYHDQILKELFWHPELKPMFRRFKVVLSNFEKLSKTVNFERPFEAVLVCTGGCHRSVAGLVLLLWALEWEGYRVDVEHLSEGSWWDRKLCLDCSKCSSSSPEKKKIASDAARLWAVVL